MKVLDLGCGDGTTAIPEAQRGAEVLGIDIASNLVEAGNKRAAAAGLANCTFQEGDACNLSGIADQSADMVVSIFGAMSAPKPFDVAKEMARVTKPGGKIVMGNWIPGDPTVAPCSPAEHMNLFKSFYGPTMNAFEAAEKNGKSADLQRELTELFNSQNTATSPDSTSIPATYLRATVSC